MSSRGRVSQSLAVSFPGRLPRDADGLSRVQGRVAFSPHSTLVPLHVSSSVSLFKHSLPASLRPPQRMRGLSSERDGALVRNTEVRIHGYMQVARM